MSLAKEFVGAPAAHAALAGFDAVTATYDSVDFMSFQAATKAKSKSKKGDPDFPTYWEAMAGPEADEWKDAMRKEIETLMNLGSWEMVHVKPSRNLATRSSSQPGLCALRDRPMATP